MSYSIVFMCQNASTPWFLIYCKELTITFVQLQSKLATFCVSSPKIQYVLKKGWSIILLPLPPKLSNYDFDIPKGKRYWVYSLEKSLCVLRTIGPNRVTKATVWTFCIIYHVWLWKRCQRWLCGYMFKLLNQGFGYTNRNKIEILWFLCKVYEKRQQWVNKGRVSS